MASYSTEYYRKNPDKYAARVAKIKAKRKEVADALKEYKKTVSCVVCGFCDYRAIDFHHRDGETKTASVAEAPMRGWSVSRMMEEISKCDPVCRNCHAIIHYPEQ